MGYDKFDPKDDQPVGFKSVRNEKLAELYNDAMKALVTHIIEMFSMAEGENSFTVDYRTGKDGGLRVHRLTLALGRYGSAMVWDREQIETLMPVLAVEYYLVTYVENPAGVPEAAKLLGVAFDEAVDAVKEGKPWKNALNEDEDTPTNMPPPAGLM